MKHEIEHFLQRRVGSLKEAVKSSSEQISNQASRWSGLKDSDGSFVRRVRRSREEAGTRKDRMKKLSDN